MLSSWNLSRPGQGYLVLPGLACRGGAESWVPGALRCAPLGRRRPLVASTRAPPTAAPEGSSDLERSGHRERLSQKQLGRRRAALHPAAEAPGASKRAGRPAAPAASSPRAAEHQRATLARAPARELAEPEGRPSERPALPAAERAAPPPRAELGVLRGPLRGRRCGLPQSPTPATPAGPHAGRLHAAPTPQGP